MSISPSASKANLKLEKYRQLNQIYKGQQSAAIKQEKARIEDSLELRQIVKRNPVPRSIYQNLPYKLAGKNQSLQQQQQSVSTKQVEK